MRSQRHSLTKIFQRNQIRATVWSFRLQKADQPVVQVWSRCCRGKPEHTHCVGLWVFHHLTSNVTLHWIYSWIPAISIYSRINVRLLVPVHVLNKQQPTKEPSVAGNTVRFLANLEGDESGSPSDASASSAASICSLTLCTNSMHLCCSKTQVLKKLHNRSKFRFKLAPGLREMLLFSFQLNKLLVKMTTKFEMICTHLFFSLVVYRRDLRVSADPWALTQHTHPILKLVSTHYI